MPASLFELVGKMIVLHRDELKMFDGNPTFVMVPSHIRVVLVFYKALHRISFVLALFHLETKHSLVRWNAQSLFLQWHDKKCSEGYCTLH